MAAALELDPGQPLHAALLTLVQGHLAPRSISGYESKFNLYLSFCLEAGLQPLPASGRHLLLFAAWLHLRGRVHPSSYPQYFSVIRTVHRDLLLPVPDHVLLPAVTRAAARLHTAAGHVRPARAPIPARVAAQALRLAAATTSPAVLLACLCFVLCFHTGLRGASVMSLKCSDVRVVSAHRYVVLVHDEKGRAHLGDQRSIPCECLYPELTALLQLLLTATAASPHARLFASLGVATDSRFGEVVHTVLEALHVQPPAEHSWLGHSCRSGMASACHALGVPVRPTICDRGGWRSDAVFQYIFPHVTDDFFSFAFFGFLLPTAQRMVAQATYAPVPLLAV